jgi:fructokinase
LSQLGEEHAAQGLIAWYLGQAICTFQAIMEPARIVIGGGVMNTQGLIERVRHEAAAAGAGYFVGNPANVIVAPGLGTNTGLLGALAVALSDRI